MAEIPIQNTRPLCADLLGNPQVLTEPDTHWPERNPWTDCLREDYGIPINVNLSNRYRMSEGEQVGSTRAMAATKQIDKPTKKPSNIGGFTDGFGDYQFM